MSPYKEVQIQAIPGQIPRLRGITPSPTEGSPFHSFRDFLAGLSQKTASLLHINNPDFSKTDNLSCIVVPVGAEAPMNPTAHLAFGYLEAWLRPPSPCTPELRLNPTQCEVEGVISASLPESAELKTLTSNH